MVVVTVCVFFVLAKPQFLQCFLNSSSFAVITWVLQSMSGLIGPSHNIGLSRQSKLLEVATRLLASDALSLSLVLLRIFGSASPDMPVKQVFALCDVNFLPQSRATRKDVPITFCRSHFENRFGDAIWFWPKTHFSLSYNIAENHCKRSVSRIGPETRIWRRRSSRWRCRDHLAKKCLNTVPNANFCSVLFRKSLTLLPGFLTLKTWIL